MHMRLGRLWRTDEEAIVLRRVYGSAAYALLGSLLIGLLRATTADAPPGVRGYTGRSLLRTQAAPEEDDE